MVKAATDTRTPRTGVVTLVPGLVVCLAGMTVAMLVHWLVPPISALLGGIVAGTLVTNTVGVRPSWQPGVAFSGRHLLRAGIVLLGLQLSLGEIARLGAGMIVVVVGIVGIGIVGTWFIGRLLRMHVRQTLLIASGFSICGAAAVAAVDGVMETDEEEVATAIGLVVLFGTLMIPLVPLAASLIGLSTHQAALWAGGSIHEVAQAVAAGGAIGDVNEAVVVKLARVLMLAPVMAGIAVLVRRHPNLSHAFDGKRPPLVPLFVVGFIATMLLTSTGWVPTSVLTCATWMQTALLATAMFALGLGVKLDKLFAVGPKPLVLGAASTVLVAGTALAGVTLFG